MTDNTARLLDAAMILAQSYLAHNQIAREDLPALLKTCHEAVSNAAAPVEQPVDTVALTPAQIRKSVRDDALVSFIDGKPYKSLKRHLTKHGLDPAGYRQRFGLPPEYPMTEPAYSRQRSALARQSGLGQRAADVGEAA